MAIPWRAVLLAIFIHSLWGANVVAAKFGLMAVPPLWSAFWRFLLAAICIMLWGRVAGVPFLPERKEWPPLLLLGVLFSTQVAVMNTGIHLTTGAMSAVLVATNPLFAALLAHFYVPGDRLTLTRSAGLVAAFGGVCLLFFRDLGLDDMAGAAEQSTALGNALVLLSAAMLGGRLVFTARLVRRMDPARVMMWQMLLALPCFAVSAMLLEQVNWAALDYRPVLGLLYQGIVVGGFAFTVNAHLLRRYDASVVLGFNFVSPLFGVWASNLLLGEAITWHLAAGMTAVALGLAFINRK